MIINTGTVIKAYSGYYYVQAYGPVPVACKLRGRIKKERFVLLVGDRVQYNLMPDGSGVIEAILPRRSMLRRPMVANVDQVLLTFAAANPDISLLLVDKFLILAELSQLPVIMCINKADIADPLMLDVFVERYRAVGYPVLLTSAQKGIGTALVRECLTDKVTVIAGPSGVGKSTLLNSVEPGLALTTGSVSAKLGRGRHTTRFAQLLPLTGGGYVVDTPGFSLTDFSGVELRQLPDCFPEFSSFAADCRFTTCLHDHEPQCAVKQAVAVGKIARERYESYLAVMAEIREQKKGSYR